MIIKRLISVILALMTVICLTPLTSYAALYYTLTYEANGGTGAPESESVFSWFSHTISSVEPKKDGLSFIGWSTSKDDAAKGIISYNYYGKNGGSKSIKLSADTTLYASYGYEVTLNCGSEGWGTSETYSVYKTPSYPLTLSSTKSAILNDYKFRPGEKNDKYDQMVFIEWNTEQDENGKGVGTAYTDTYNENKPAALYCIWGYPVIYNADGGYFPSNGSELFQTYVCGYDNEDYENPKTVYGNFGFPDGDNAPVKPGCRLATLASGASYYILLTKDMKAFTSETAENNLTIPPEASSGLDWSDFHTSHNDRGDLAVEFFAPWEPSITYYPNNQLCSLHTDYLTYDWGTLYNYCDYAIRDPEEIGFTSGGKKFAGWNTKPDGTGKTYAPGDIINKLPNSDPITLYAIWTVNNTGKATLGSSSVKYDLDRAVTLFSTGNYKSITLQNGAVLNGNLPKLASDQKLIINSGAECSCDIEAESGARVYVAVGAVWQDWADGRIYKYNGKNWIDDTYVDIMLGIPSTLPEGSEEQALKICTYIRNDHAADDLCEYGMIFIPEKVSSDKPDKITLETPLAAVASSGKKPVYENDLCEFTAALYGIPLTRFYDNFYVRAFYTLKIGDTPVTFYDDEFRVASVEQVLYYID